MKINLILVLFISCTASGQTWQEWTKQKKTQVKYLLQQIAANKVYLDYVQQGYKIANNGLQAIRRIKDGDITLHRDFFAAHRTVNPKIRNAAKVTATIALQVKILKEAKLCLALAREGRRFTASELRYCVLVFDNLLADCAATLGELVVVITTGGLSMTDDERIRRIDELYSDMQSNFGFCCSFSGEINVLSIQRLGEQINVQRSKVINGLE